ncbi:UNVERIFIED_CONTAM: hypothetical protein RMT77_012857 [Armadillidium vulgare]
MTSKLTAKERDTSLKALLDDGWQEVDGRDAIKKEYVFINFIEAWSWMSSIALESEKNNHHPEWYNVYNKVEVIWSTHDVGGLSLLDIKMGYFCDNTYKRHEQNDF